jgi:hypothetical protein
MRVEIRTVQESEGQPWFKLPEENALWFGRFKEWLRQTPPRSVLALYNQERARRGARSDAFTLPSAWVRAKARYQWIARVEAWDAAEQERLDRALTERREAERQTELRIAEELREKARALLALPVTVEMVKRNREGQEVAFLLIPEFRAFKVASDILGQAKAHARTALEMPDKFDRQELVGKDSGPVETKAVGSTPEERLGRLLALTRQVLPLSKRKEDENAQRGVENKLDGLLSPLGHTPEAGPDAGDGRKKRQGDVSHARPLLELGGGRC